MRELSLRFRLLVATSALLATSLSAQILQPAEPVAPLPETANDHPRAAAIGEKLFSDVRLSRNLDQACVTCHPLDRGGMDGLQVAALPDGNSHFRNTPTIFNVGFNPTLNWDGVVDTLEKHTERLLTTLMKITWTELLARLRDDAEYRAALPEGVTRSSVLHAMASFERSLATPNSRFDRYLRGELHALTAREERGYALFKRYGCASCHQGMNVGGNLFQKFGVFEDMTQPPSHPIDMGRALVTKVPRDQQVFRVPSLRNVAVTGPYFHDGRQGRLDAAVDTMARAQLGRRLAPDEIDRIVDFLRTLTGEYRGRLLTVAPSRAQR
jgi:cytochrome c peroxidase